MIPPKPKEKAMRVVLFITTAMIVGAVGLSAVHSAMAKEPRRVCEQDSKGHVRCLPDPNRSSPDPRFKSSKPKKPQSER
jgi:hypothetical protein